MVIGNIAGEKPSDVEYPAVIGRALTYLRETDFTKVADGRYELDGDRMYADVQRYMTVPDEELRPEAHRRYLDIQFIAEGEEYIGWCAFSPAMKPTAPYDEEKDIMFFERLEPESCFALTKGSFAILTPKDIHRPRGMIGDRPSRVTKVVVKIALALLRENEK